MPAAIVHRQPRATANSASQQDQQCNTNCSKNKQRSYGIKKNRTKDYALRALIASKYKRCELYIHDTTKQLLLIMINQ